MAFDASNLYKVGGANPGLWIYHSTDAVGDIDADGYFTNTTELKQYDVIFVIGSTGGTQTIDTFAVYSATGSTVQVRVLA
tara:strand:+ start:1451 stop:1690 length:240 start_codon:yes stop_codon:yes gene_type:complete